jgi:hypothetical protein
MMLIAAADMLFAAAHSRCLRMPPPLPLIRRLLRDTPAPRAMRAMLPRRCHARRYARAAEFSPPPLRLCCVFAVFHCHACSCFCRRRRRCRRIVLPIIFAIFRRRHFRHVFAAFRYASGIPRRRYAAAASARGCRAISPIFAPPQRQPPLYAFAADAAIKRCRRLISPLTPLRCALITPPTQHAVFHAMPPPPVVSRHADAASTPHYAAMLFADAVLSFSSFRCVLQTILLFAGFRFRLHDFLEAFSRHATPRRYADIDTTFFAPIFRAPLLFYRLAIAMRFHCFSMLLLAFRLSRRRRRAWLPAATRPPLRCVTAAARFSLILFFA